MIMLKQNKVYTFSLGKYYTSLRLAPISFLGHSALVAAAGPIAPGKICVLLT